MKIDNVLAVHSREELRNWLGNNGPTGQACWVAVSMKPKPGVLLYLDVVEEALCHGWIDGIKKKTDHSETLQRLSPRSKKSSWTELNKERVRRLEKLGFMREEWRQVLPDMDPAAFTIDRVIEERLREEQQVYENFLAFPALYQRVRIDTIQSVRNQPELFQRRLDKLITRTRENKMYGQWHDNGRLLNDEPLMFSEKTN